MVLGKSLFLKEMRSERVNKKAFDEGLSVAVCLPHLSPFAFEIDSCPGPSWQMKGVCALST